MRNLVIRDGLPSDVPPMLTILKEVAQMHERERADIFKESTHHPVEDGLREAMEGGNTKAIVAERDGGMVGVLLLRVRAVEDHPSLRDGKTLWVDDLCVAEEYRGRGIGGALMDAAMELARREGAHRVELNVWAFNEGAIRFYQRYGMKTQRMIMELPLA